MCRIKRALADFVSVLTQNEITRAARTTTRGFTQPRKITLTDVLLFYTFRFAETTHKDISAFFSKLERPKVSNIVRNKSNVYKDYTRTVEHDGDICIPFNRTWYRRMKRNDCRSFAEGLSALPLRMVKNRYEYILNERKKRQEPAVAEAIYLTNLDRDRFPKDRIVHLYHEQRWDYETGRLITLVEDIIRLSRLDEGAAELEKEDVDLYALTREILSRLSPQAADREVHLKLTGEPVVYNGIRRILDEMIYNICENAVKYNKKGGSVTVWAGSTLAGKKVIVTDMGIGIGIPKEQQERIFERFYRVDKSHSRESGGTGLGLSIVKHGAMIHGAGIHVDSEVGKGTRIEITFPNG